MSLHPAKKEAIQLFKAWSYGREGDDCFPVDCHAIATGLVSESSRVMWAMIFRDVC